MTGDVSAPPLPTNAEIQHALCNIRATDFSFAGKMRSFRDPDLTKDLGQLLQRDLEDLLVDLGNESRKRALRRSLARWAALIVSIGWLCGAIAMHDLSWRTLFFLYIPIGLVFLSGMASQQAQLAALAISRLDDVRAIGSLAEALEFPDRDIRPIARKALIHLLPRLKASDAALLSSAQRACLNRTLRGDQSELILAILKAWEQVGDPKAIPAVRSLAEGRGECGQIPEVVQAAKECLPFLQQSLEQRQNDTQLLRSADGNRAPAESLLRPATSQVSAEPANQLLRPTDII
ncbi:MAG: hypothetical protein JWL77_861 [Chthonomonadaceae bacterium]|nr:hypothetical protein [Chthonomonadaceae bacterium]